MARKARKLQDSSDDDDAPEVVPHSASKADAKRSQKALHDFEAGERARRKARNRERDRKLKERALVTKGGKAGGKSKGVRFSDQVLEDAGGSNEDVDDGDGGVEARMLRAMKDAADEVHSSEGEQGYEDGEFVGFGQGVDLDDENSSFALDEDDEDAGMSSQERDSADAEALADDEEMGEDESTASLQANIVRRPGGKANYLADDLFAAAFASQSSKSIPKKCAESTQQQVVKERRRKSTTRPKDLVIGGRTIRTLPQLSDPRSQATARSVPAARARRFMDQSLAMRGKQALVKAKKRGWERRPVNVGVMKHQGAPHGFARSVLNTA